VVQNKFLHHIQATSMEVVMAGETTGDAAAPTQKINFKGPLYAVAATFLFSMVNICVKHIGVGLPVAEILFFRAAVALVVLIPLTPRASMLEFFQPGACRWLEVIRSLAGMFGLTCCFFAVTRLKLAEFVAIGYTTPLILALMAWMVLKERINPIRWLAIMSGAAGVLILVQPQLESNGAGLLPIAVLILGCFFTASTHVMTKQLKGRASSMSIVFNYMWIGTAITAPLAVANWQTPTQEQLIMLIALGSSGAIAQLFMTKALELSEASLLSPLFYLSVGWQTAIAWQFFGESMTGREVISMLLLVLDGLLAFWSLKERRLRKGETHA